MRRKKTLLTGSNDDENHMNPVTRRSSTTGSQSGPIRTSAERKNCVHIATRLKEIFHPGTRRSIAISMRNAHASEWQIEIEKERQRHYC